MVRDVRLDAAGGLVLLSWRTAEDGLFLTVPGQGEEVRLQCICGRCHWIVREQFQPDRAQLLVSCHNCGERTTFLIEGAKLPAP
ncbi:MAG: hypothetical protein AABX97_01790 [Candidatus Thermoplasmatota archaeon]